MKFSHFVSNGADKIVEAGYHCGDSDKEVHQKLHDAGFLGITLEQTVAACQAYRKQVDDEIDVNQFVRSIPLPQDAQGRTPDLSPSVILGELGAFLGFCNTYRFVRPVVNSQGTSEWPDSTRKAWYGFISYAHNREISSEAFRAQNRMTSRAPKSVEALRIMINNLIRR